MASLHRLAKLTDSTVPEADRPAFEDVLSTLYGYVAQGLEGLKPNQIATSLYAIAKLGYFNGELVGGLSRRAFLRFSAFNSIEFSNTAFALAKMNYQPGREWLDEFVRRSAADLGAFRPIELSSTIASLAKLGCSPTQEWLDAFAAAFAANVGGLTGQQYCSTVYHLGLAASGLGGSAALPAAALDGAVSQQASRLERMTASDLSRTAWALTQFNGYSPSATWMDAYHRALGEKLRYAGPEDLATTMYSLAYLKAQPPKRLLSSFVACMERQLDRLSGDNLASCACALAIFQFPPPSGRSMDELLICLQRKLNDCSEDGLAKLVTGLPLLGSRGDVRLMDVVNAAQGRLEQLRQAQQAEAAGGDDAPAEPAAAYAGAGTAAA